MKNALFSSQIQYEDIATLYHEAFSIDAVSSHYKKVCNFKMWIIIFAIDSIGSKSGKTYSDMSKDISRDRNIKNIIDSKQWYRYSDLGKFLVDHLNDIDLFIERFKYYHIEIIVKNTRFRINEAFIESVINDEKNNVEHRRPSLLSKKSYINYLNEKIDQQKNDVQEPTQVISENVYSIEKIIGSGNLFQIKHLLNHLCLERKNYRSSGGPICVPDYNYKKFFQNIFLFIALLMIPLLLMALHRICQVINAVLYFPMD